METMSHQEQVIHVQHNSTNNSKLEENIRPYHGLEISEISEFTSDCSQLTGSEFTESIELTELAMQQQLYLEALNLEIDTISLTSKSTALETRDLTTANSNQKTPTPKVLNTGDADLAIMKKAFARLKQTNELMNTERVYLVSLEILKRDYIDNIMSNINTPLFFIAFSDCISKLIQYHKMLYGKVQSVYFSWASECLKLDKDDNKDTVKQLKSPAFDQFQYIPIALEKKYLQQIVYILESESIDINIYGEYCSLFNRVVLFSIKNNIERYKRNTLSIVNDFTISHKYLKRDYLIDQTIDTRFISVVQMPTNRICRYKLIISSLSKYVDFLGDSDISGMLKKAEQRLGTAIDKVNEIVGHTNAKYEQLDKFKKIYDGLVPRLGSKSSGAVFAKCPLGSIFFDSLSFINKVGSMILIYYDMEHKRLVYTSVITALFDTHIIFGKPSTIYSGKAEVLLSLPLASIVNYQEIISKRYSSFNYYTLATQFESVLNIVFENNFEIHEIALVFADENEARVWMDTTSDVMSKNNDLNIKSEEWAFSGLQQSIRQLDLGNEAESFKVCSYIPLEISTIKSTLTESNQIHVFEVEALNDTLLTATATSTDKTKLNDSTITPVAAMVSQTLNYPRTPNFQLQREASRASLYSKKSFVVKQSLQDRVVAQACLGDLWDPSFTKYQVPLGFHSTLGSLSRSFSNLFLRSDANTTTEQNPTSYVKSLRTSDSITSLSSFLQPSARSHDTPAADTSPSKQRRIPKASCKTGNNNEQIDMTPDKTNTITADSPLSVHGVATKGSLLVRGNQSTKKLLDRQTAIEIPDEMVSCERKRDWLKKSLGIKVKAARPRADERCEEPLTLRNSGSMRSLASCSRRRTGSRSNISELFKSLQKNGV